MTTLNIIIYGCGGHAKVVADIVEKTGKYQIIGFIDDTRSECGTFLDYPVYTSISNPHLDAITAGIVAIGDNWVRACVVEKIIQQIPHFQFITAVYPSTHIGRGVKIGCGTVIMPGVTINADTFIGRHCILNTSSSIDHDCKFEDFVSIAPGVIVGGNVTIGPSTAVGLGTKVIHRIDIGQNTVIGAGSLVTKSLPDNIMAYGSPCKFVRARNYGDSYL